MMSIQVHKVEKGQVALQESMDRVLEELARMRLDTGSPGAAASGSTGDPPQAKSASARPAPAPSGAGSADGFKVFVQGFADEHPRGKLAAFHGSVVAQLPPAATAGARALIGPAASSFAVLFGTQDQALHFLREVRALPDAIRFPIGDAEGDIITFAPQRNSEPTQYGRALSPVWEVLAPLLRASVKFNAIGNAKFMTDPRKGVMRVISADQVWRLCEVIAALGDGHPRLRVNREVFKEFGLARSDWEAVEASFDGVAVRLS